jgi:cytochrome c oxidase assembly protein subunit 15
MTAMSPEQSRAIAKKLAFWATLACLLAVVVIMLGAWTRLVHAGLGCPDWPGCYGFLTVPQDETRIAIANARFPETPVDVSKGWPEMIHRYAAGTLGLLVFGLAIASVRNRRAGLPVKLPLFIAGFIVLQAAFGMWTVTLKLWPQVAWAQSLCWVIWPYCWGCCGASAPRAVSTGLSLWWAVPWCSSSVWG